MSGAVGSVRVIVRVALLSPVIFAWVLGAPLIFPLFVVIAFAVGDESPLETGWRIVAEPSVGWWNVLRHGDFDGAKAP